MSKSDAFENDLLKLIFNAVAIADLADNDATSPATNLAVALHTASPGEAGTQATNEIIYSGYSRINVVRSAAGWLVSGNTVFPVNNIDFGEMTDGAGGIVTHASVGVPGTNRSLYYGTVTPNINVVNGVIPRLKTTSTITED